MSKIDIAVAAMHHGQSVHNHVPHHHNPLSPKNEMKAVMLKSMMGALQHTMQHDEARQKKANEELKKSIEGQG